MDLPNKKLKQEELERKIRKREKKKNVVMKVDAAGIKKLREIIAKKGKF